MSSNANYQGSARGRVGYAFDRTMVYATGGVGWINNEVTVNATVGPFTVGVSDSQMHIGGVVGAGVEHAFAPNWSVKAEYLYAIYGSRPTSARSAAASRPTPTRTRSRLA